MFVPQYLQVVLRLVGHDAGRELVSIHVGLDARVLLTWKEGDSWGLTGQQQEQHTRPRCDVTSCDAKTGHMIATHIGYLYIIIFSYILDLFDLFISVCLIHY